MSHVKIPFDVPNIGPRKRLAIVVLPYRAGTPPNVVASIALPTFPTSFAHVLESDAYDFVGTGEAIPVRETP